MCPIAISHGFLSRSECKRTLRFEVEEDTHVQYSPLQIWKSQDKREGGKNENGEIW